jgi:hypothetical protein
MLEYAKTDKEYQIVLEPCRGGELFTRIKDRGRYSETDAKRIVK